MEPHFLVGGTGEGSWVGMGLACGLQDQRLMARPPARAGGRSGSLTGGKSGKRNGFSPPFPKGYLSTSPARPAGGRAVTSVTKRGPQAGYPVRGTASPHTTPPEKGVPGEEPPPPGFFPPFLPKKWGPGRAGPVPRRSNGWEAPTGTRVPTPGRLIFQGNKKVPAAYAAGTHVAVYLITSAQP